MLLRFIDSAVGRGGVGVVLRCSATGSSHTLLLQWQWMARPQESTTCHRNTVATQIVTIIEPVSKFDSPPRCTMSDVELKSTSFLQCFMFVFLELIWCSAYVWALKIRDFLQNWFEPECWKSQRWFGQQRVKKHFLSITRCLLLKWLLHITCPCYCESKLWIVFWWGTVLHFSARCLPN
jgi:hypothetical protein